MYFCNFFCGLMKIIENAAFFRREIEFANKKQRFLVKFPKKLEKKRHGFSPNFKQFQRFSTVFQN